MTPIAALRRPDGEGYWDAEGALETEHGSPG